MKKLIICLFIFALFAGAVFAQNRDSRPNRNGQKKETQPGPQGKAEITKVTIEGILQLEKGFVSVASGDSVYYVPKLNRYIGFIDGLKEGAKVSVEGSQFKDFIRPVKVTINGKTYDFPEYGKRDNNNRLSQGRENFKQPRNLSNRGKQARPFGRGGFCDRCR